MDSGLPTLIHEDSWKLFTCWCLILEYQSILTSFATQSYRADVADQWKMFVKTKRINTCWKLTTTSCFDSWHSFPENTQWWFNDDKCWNNVAKLVNVISRLNGRHLINVDSTLNSTMKQHRFWVDAKSSFDDNLQGLSNYNIHILAYKSLTHFNFEATSIIRGPLSFHFHSNINVETTAMNVDDQRRFSVDLTFMCLQGSSLCWGLLIISIESCRSTSSSPSCWICEGSLSNMEIAARMACNVI